MPGLGSVTADSGESWGSASWMSTSQSSDQGSSNCVMQAVARCVTRNLTIHNAIH